jgi:hypothetical protein
MVVVTVLFFDQVLEELLAVFEVVAVGVSPGNVGGELKDVVIVLASVATEGVKGEFAGLPRLIERMLQEATFSDECVYLLAKLLAGCFAGHSFSLT